MLTDDRPTADRRPFHVPAHGHFTMGSIAVVALVVGVVAALLGFGTALSLANHSDVERDTVDAFVDQRFDSRADDFEAMIPTLIPAPTPASGDSTGQPAAQPATDVFGSVIPELTPVAQLALAPATEAHTAYAPNVPPPIARSTQAIVEVEFEVVEQLSTIDPATGVQFETWGYRLAGDDATIAAGTPGPIIRARVGDIVRFRITNPSTNLNSHNVDFHAITGQGGGAADTLVAPGESAVIEARALYPGMFMYHCAAGDVPAHIAHGMYGGILIDPETPLPAADKEFYIVQSEYYLMDDGSDVMALDRGAMTMEHPTMVVFNGGKGALTGDNALEIAVGDRARFYFVNAGLNLDSNFHPIGSHWDAVWQEAALLSAPVRGSQTTLVPAGGGVVADLIGQVPSAIILVDHALTRTFDKGAIGIVTVVGDENPEIFRVGESEQTGAAPASPTVSAGATTVNILAGSWAPQALDAPDEFDEGENPPDYAVNILTVKVGTTVAWINQDDQAHSVTAVDGSFDSGLLGNGAVFEQTFDTPGEYEYYCLPHPWMRAKVLVEP
ncbi:MAG: plastocyanin/azurin family copper-binding protein [Acidimicrobiia bacterium]|nr:plastocyanin/azurin family copper-binding protein [Acidimicrobiia bacterium]